MRKETRKFYFSAEGYTEHWYLMWLQSQINHAVDAKYSISINSSVKTNPLKRVKSITVLEKTEVTHLFDYESEQAEHVDRFKRILEQMIEAHEMNRNIAFRMGYSNYSFELWIVLHKISCNRSLSDRTQYLPLINRAFGENFEDLHQYKEEKNFHRLLEKLTLPEVNLAIDRAQTIQRNNEQVGYVLQNYKGYRFYRENPSLSIDQSIEQILRVCGLRA